MYYKLSQDLIDKLKEAGYPGLLDNNQEMQNPPLEELILNCNYGFRSLSYHTHGYWLARSGYMTDSIRATGKTPREAVARLYISLKKRRVKF